MSRRHLVSRGFRALPRRRGFGVLFCRAAVMAGLAIELAGVDAAAAAAHATAPQLAYVDPGAGSFILQALVAMLAGIVVALNAYWTRIKKFFRGADPEPDEGKGAPRGDG